MKHPSAHRILMRKKEYEVVSCLLKQISYLIVMSVSAFGLFHSAASSLSVRGSKCKSSWEWNKKRHNGSLWVLDTSAHCDDTVDHVKEAVIHIYHCKERYNIEDNLQNKTACAEQDCRASFYPESTQKWFQPEASRSPHVTIKRGLDHQHQSCANGRNKKDTAPVHSSSP